MQCCKEYFQKILSKYSNTFQIILVLFCSLGIILIIIYTYLYYLLNSSTMFSMFSPKMYYDYFIFVKTS
jgi:hypothetical protein